MDGKRRQEFFSRLGHAAGDAGLEINEAGAESSSGSAITSCRKGDDVLDTGVSPTVTAADVSPSS